jgi:Rrf2 family protein
VQARLPHIARIQIFAIAVVTDIAIHSRHERVTTKRIASRLNLPKPRYLESMLGALTHKGIIISSPGTHGGYRLARKARLISADDILRALSDGATNESRSVIARQVVLPALRQAEKAFSEALQRLTVDVLVRHASPIKNREGGDSDSGPE